MFPCKLLRVVNIVNMNVIAQTLIGCPGSYLSLKILMCGWNNFHKNINTGSRHSTKFRTKNLICLPGAVLPACGSSAFGSAVKQASESNNVWAWQTQSLLHTHCTVMILRLILAAGGHLI